MEELVYLAFLAVGFGFIISLSFSIVSLCYSWMKLKMTEMDSWMDRK